MQSKSHGRCVLAATALASALLAEAAGALAQAPDAVPLRPGGLTFRVTTVETEAQAYFDRGLRLTYDRDRAAALSAFRAAQRIDPACAMCFWGEALVLGPKLDAPMTAEAVVPAVSAMAKAQVRAPYTTPRERALIAALAGRYSTDPEAERGALDAAYAHAMAGVHARFPADDHVAVLYAEALLVTLSPPDDWDEAVAALESVLARNPEHPAATRLYVHALEASSAEADTAEAGGMDLLPAGYYPHTIHFIVASAQMTGAVEVAFEAAHRLNRTIADEAARETAWVQAVKVAPYFVQAQYGDLSTLEEVPDPGAEFPFVRALWHFARAVTFADAGRMAEAEAERAALAEIGARHGFRDMVRGGVPAPEMLRIAYHVIGARMAFHRGDYEAAVLGYRAAAAVQDTFPCMEPPYWYVPLRQSLGGALLAAGRPEEAEAAFRAALKEAPDNGWALYGLAEALRQQGWDIPALLVGRALDRVWLGSRDVLKLHRL